MKQLSILFILLLFSSTTFAQKDSAKQIIDRVKNYYQSNQSFSADILFEVDIPESQNQVMNGKIYLKGNKYKFELDEQVIISDDVNLWHWSKGEINEVQVSYVKNDENIITPAKVFSEFLSGYSYKLDGTPTIDGQQLALIEITPKKIDDYQDIFKIKVVVNTKQHTVKNMKIFYKDGVVYNFEVSNEQKVKKDDSFFQFSKAEHPEVELIDLR